MAHPSSWCLLEDREGNLWLGTSFGGLHRLKDRYFSVVDFQNGLPDRLARVLTPEGPGRLIVGTHGGGLAHLEGRQVLSPSVPAPRYHVTSVLRDRQGRVWFGAFEGLFLETTGRPRAEGALARLGPIFALLEDSTGRIWAGAQHGIGRLEGEQWQVWKDASALAGSQVSVMAEDRSSGTLWVGTYAQGLFGFNSTNVIHLSAAPKALPGPRISSLFVDEDGCLWAGVFGQGLVVVRSNIVAGWVGEAQGLPAKTVGSILMEGGDNCWLGSDRGILRISMTHLHQIARDRVSRPFDLFDEADGMHSRECAEGVQPAAAREETGRLWFATGNGLVTVDPRRLKFNTNAPPLTVERVVYNDRQGKRREMLSPPAQISLPAGNTEVEVQVAALTFVAPERVNYAYRIEGTERGLGQAGESARDQLPKPASRPLPARAQGNARRERPWCGARRGDPDCSASLLASALVPHSDGVGRDRRGGRSGVARPAEEVTAPTAATGTGAGLGPGAGPPGIGP